MNFRTAFDTPPPLFRNFSKNSSVFEIGGLPNEVSVLWVFYLVFSLAFFLVFFPVFPLVFSPAFSQVFFLALSLVFSLVAYKPVYICKGHLRPKWICKELFCPYILSYFLATSTALIVWSKRLAEDFVCWLEWKFSKNGLSMPCGPKRAPCGGNRTKSTEQKPEVNSYWCWHYSMIAWNW